MGRHSLKTLRVLPLYCSWSDNDDSGDNEITPQRASLRLGILETVRGEKRRRSLLAAGKKK